MNVDFSGQTLPPKDPFILPLGPVIGFPSMIVFAILSSFADRKWRLLVFCPSQSFIMIVILPIYIISRNDKMKKEFLINWINFRPSAVGPTFTFKK